MNLKEKIENWYEGEFVAYKNDPFSDLVILGGDYERHWTAKIARSLIDFYLSHWKWLWGFIATVSSLYIAYLKL